MRRVVIVGASAAGMTCAETLRRLGFDGELTVVGDEEMLPHDRPPLSKQVLAGSWPPEQAELMSAERREKVRATLHLGRSARTLDVVRRRVVLDDDAAVPFDDVVIATGVRPRRIAGSDAQGVHVLRTLRDALALRADILASKHLVVVGAGFLGLETAATARSLGAEVTVVEPVSEPLRGRLGSVAARRLLALHRRNGVDLRVGVGIEAIEVDDAQRVVGLRLTDHTTAETSVVLLAIGCVPNVEWLASSGLDLTDGVECDETCRAAEGVWAAGDVARWRHVGLGRSVRIEHRLNASEQGMAVAQNLLGPASPFAPTPFFWSDHYDAKIQVAGTITESTEERIVAEDGANSFVHAYYEDGRLSGVLGWNATKAMMPFRQELRAANAAALAAR